MNYVVSNVDLSSSKTHPFISFRNFLSCSSRIYEVHIIWYGMDIKKNEVVVSDFSIRNGKGGVFSYIDNMESPYSSIWSKGVVT